MQFEEEISENRRIERKGTEGFQTYILINSKIENIFFLFDTAQFINIYFVGISISCENDLFFFCLFVFLYFILSVIEFSVCRRRASHITIGNYA